MKIPNRATLLALTLPCCLNVGTLHAVSPAVGATPQDQARPQQAERNPEQERARQEQEELKPGSGDDGGDKPLFQFRNRLILEGESHRNPDLERGEIEKEHELEPQWRFSALIAEGRPVWGYVETELLHKMERKTGDRAEHVNRWRVNHAYVAFANLLPDTEIKVGRWLYRDEREWLYDENFDGVHLETEHKDLTVEVFGARVSHWQRDLFDSHSRGQGVNYWAGRVSYEVEDDWDVGAYVVGNHDPDDADGGGDRTRRYGVRSHRTPSKGLRHWLEIGRVQGRQDGRPVSGNVLDVGLTQVMRDVDWRPRLTVGYARASGGVDGEGRYRGYRQTGLQSNEATYGGLVKFKIYGETLDPELRNLEIATAGLGLRPNRDLTLDLVYHRYWQPRIASLADMEWEIDPRGDTRSGHHLGDGMDLIIGWRPVKAFTAHLAVGHFRPGSRLRDSRDLDTSQRAGSATSARIKLDWRF